MRNGLTISRVAKAAGVPVETVRYYERRHLLVPASRMDTGYRLYDDQSIRRLRFIKNAQRLGFTLQEISVLLNLRVQSPTQCENVKQTAEAKLQQVKGKIRSLRLLARALQKLVAACDAEQQTGACPLLQALEEPPLQAFKSRRSIH